jgi:hypothetical protein
VFDEVAIAFLAAGIDGLDMLDYSGGTTIGFSLTGDLIDPGLDPKLLAAFAMTNTTEEFSGTFTVTVDEWVFAGDTGQELIGCDTGFVQFYGCDVSDTFDFGVDCAGDWYGGEDGWDYTDQCGECDENPLTDCYDLSIDLHDGANLISFPALPDNGDFSVENVFGGLGDNVIGVIGEGVGTVNLPDIGYVGSLSDVAQDDGYWVKVSSAADLGVGDADPVSYDEDGEVDYTMHSGNNLISYPFQNSQALEDALGGAAGNVWGIAGEGVAALNTGGGWYGSLEAFQGSRGYWLIANADFDFTFNGTADGIARQAEQPPVREVPEAYSYVQTTKQAFYFVKSATIHGEPLDGEDLIIAYNGDVVVGSRYWNGEYTDIPAMGVDENEMSAGYSNPGDEITFKIYDASTGEFVGMEVEGESSWQDIGMFVIKLSDKILPTEVSLGNAYPNPFNPATRLSYDVPADMNVSLAVYDVRGRMVQELVNDLKDQGRYTVIWNADRQSSGVYMIKLVAGNTVKVQKVMLVK